MIKFEKVSFSEYLDSRMSHNGMNEDACNKYVRQYRYEWENIKLPTRSTSGSAGYDFYAPFDINIEEPYFNSRGISNQDWVTFPTGIRFVTDRNDVFLMCVPRSGLGFKKINRLANTCGIIDSDYSNSDNEGHISVKMTSDVATHIQSGKAFMQGIIVPFAITDNDNVTVKRNGGFGSTDNEKK